MKNGVVKLIEFRFHEEDHEEVRWGHGYSKGKTYGRRTNGQRCRSDGKRYSYKRNNIQLTERY
ncbi:hypothetical protein [Candidatus Hodgkinia cicadicola]|uniref:hypothetical protein n=1 Tax=Candidatus Hodgkinia cicadicola TaxID=573658 RepID=UPI0011BACD0C